MTRTDVIAAFRIGAKIGVIAGCLGAGFEFIQYLADRSFFYSGAALIVYVLGFVVFVPTAFFLLNKRTASQYLPDVISLTTAYFLCMVIVAGCQVLLHYAIDRQYRETVATRKMERFEENRRQRERDTNATIETDYNEREIRDEELAKYELQAILMKPVRLLPICLILACLAALLVATLRRATA